MSMKIEVWGDYACFTRPEMKVERVSYDIMTPSAARAIVEAIYWHPGIVVHIEKIYLLNPIRFTNIRRNEVSSVVSAYTALDAFKKNTQQAIYIEKDRQQRASRILKSVRYVIEFHVSFSKEVTYHEIKKVEAIFKRRLNKGQCYTQPYFGIREYVAYFREWPECEPIPTLPYTMDLGFMLYDMNYSNPENIRPQFFRAKLVDGILNLNDCEVFE